MNIQSTAVTQRPLSREDRKELYQTAKVEAKETREQFWATRKDLYEKADTYGLRTGLAVGVATTAVTSGLSLAFGDFLGSSTQLINGAIATLTLGAAAGIGVGAGVQLYHQVQAERQMGESLRPLVKEKDAALTVTRQHYREALIEEMNDEGVVEATQETWDELRAQERKPVNLGHFMDIRQALDTEVSNLESLADSRLEGGWTGRLANLEDNPTFFADQISTIERYPNLKEVVSNPGS